MRKTLKKYFIPHKENDHRPHILRKEATLFFIAVIFVIELFFLAGVNYSPEYRGYFASIIRGVLVDETNINRVRQNLESLETNPLLEFAAEEKAKDMALKGYFSHVGPEGKTPWQWLGEAGYEYSYAGENLAVNFIDSQDVVNAWMNSEGHRANILNGKYTEIGIGTATGTYKGRETVFIAQYFGKPLARPTINVAPVINVAKAASSSEITKVNLSTVSTTKENTSNESKIVLGETINTNQSSTEESHFLAIVNTEVPEEQSEIKVSSGAVVRKSNIIKKTLSAPKSVVNDLLSVFGFIILLALILKIFIKVEIQHPILIMNGVILITLIVSALFLNKYIGYINAQIL